MLRGLLERGWTQSEITRRTGIPQPRLSKWARGMVPSGADDALKLKQLHDESTTASGAEVGAKTGSRELADGLHAATVAQPPAQASADQNLGEKF